MGRPFLICMTLLFLGCTGERSVELVRVGDVGIQELCDLSVVYFFYDTSHADTLVVNRNNLITSTHWVFHIDKKLSLARVAPALVQLQEKKRSAKMHKNEEARNYFSAMDTLSGNLTFLDFTATSFLLRDQFSKFYLKDHSDDHMPFFNVRVNFDDKNNITVDGNKVTRSELLVFLREYVDFSRNGLPALLHLNMSDKLLFKDYVHNKSLLMSAENAYTRLATKEFIYDRALLPDCECAL